MPLLTAMRRTPKLSDEQRALRQAWDAVTEKLREYRMELDMSLPAPLNAVAEWLLRAEAALAEDEKDPQDHERAAEEAREKQDILRSSLEEMPQQLKTFQNFQNQDEYGNVLVPADKMDELKRRFTSVRVTAKYHGIKLEYREHRHSVLDLLSQIKTKLRLWKRPYVSSEGVRLLLQEWHELVDRQELPSLLETALYKVKQVSEKYSSKSALASEYNQVMQQVRRMEEDSRQVQEELKTVKGMMGRVLSAWDSYSDCLSSLQAWLQQGTRAHGLLEHRAQVSSGSIAEWGSRQAHLNEVGTFLIESTDPQTSRVLTEELRRVNLQWADFIKRNTFDGAAVPGPVLESRSPDLQALIREATQILKEPLETLAAPLRTYRKRLQFIMTKIKEVDVDSLSPSPECPAEQLNKLKMALPEVLQTLCEAEQVCTELQHSVSGLDTRLAEVLHWETEARDLYKLLKNQERPSRGQDPRVRILISRGLQLEGQVDRVKAVVQISQEAVGMLSSIGLRRERSPRTALLLLKSLSSPKMSQNKSQSGIFTPQIVVHEAQMEKTVSPPMPYSYAEAVTRTKSPMDVTIEIQSETVTQFSSHEQKVLREPQDEEMVVQDGGIKPFQEMIQPMQQEEMSKTQQVQDVVTQVKVEKQVSEVHEKGLVEQIAVKKTMTIQELKARKAQAAKNRPWLQKLCQIRRNLKPQVKIQLKNRSK
ncbi:hypothetical protein WMY93_027561 [Mugilogobius chulae]|uniref:Nesprin-1 spectrin repeats region domain-containing protein n=1 Tax=Mugilogobius chulae TaxID=88201 RepID=A0AAW0MTB6_9GOBI